MRPQGHTAHIVVTAFALLMAGCAAPVSQRTTDHKDLEHELNSANPARLVAAKSLLQDAKKDVKNLGQRLATKKLVWKSEQQSNLTAEIFVNIKANNVCTVHMVGPLDSKSPRYFLQVANYALQNDCKDVLVKIDSPGGLLVAGIKIGIYIRKLNWNTLAWNSSKGPLFSSYNVPNERLWLGCVSSCAIAFMGGVQRYSFRGIADGLKRDASLVYFHQVKNKHLCENSPRDMSNIVVYEYFKIVAPDIAISLLREMLDQSCNSAERAVNRWTHFREKMSSSYSDETYQKYRIKFCNKEECQN